jgi:hypothetical protein
MAIKISEIPTTLSAITNETLVEVSEKIGETYTTKKYDLKQISDSIVFNHVMNVLAYKGDTAWQAEDGIAVIYSPALTITGVKMFSLETGSVKVDIKKNGTSICGTSLPEIVSGTSYSDMTLDGWTTSIAEWDQLLFEIVSCTDIKNFVIALSVQM